MWRARSGYTSADRSLISGPRYWTRFRIADGETFYCSAGFSRRNRHWRCAHATGKRDNGSGMTGRARLLAAKRTGVRLGFISVRPCYVRRSGKKRVRRPSSCSGLIICRGRRKVLFSVRIKANNVIPPNTVRSNFFPIFSAPFVETIRLEDVKRVVKGLCPVRSRTVVDIGPT